MPFGVTTEGFVTKTIEDIKAEIEAALKAEFGESIDVSPQSNFGQIVGVMAERYADLWALAEAIYSAFTPDGASGVSLDNVCAITGTVREPARPSEVSIIATGTPTTVLSAGRVASVDGTGIRFVTLADGTITLATSWAALTAYAVGDVRTNASRIYIVTTAGTSAGAGGPTTTSTAIVDGTVTWRYLGEGTGYVAIDAESEDDGAKVASAFTLTTIETPVSGWSNVTNLLDADLGADEETDAALRLRREDELRTSGNAALDAIRARLLQVDDVTAATVFENTTDVTNGDGMPPHSVEALVQDGDDQEIADALFSAVAAGIATHGTETETVTDSAGNDHEVKFTRPTEELIWVIVNVTVDEDLYPTDGDTQIKEAIVEFGDAQRTGKDAVASSLVAQAFSVAGVLDATVLIGTTNPPVASTTIAIGLRELAVFDTSRITVNSTPGTP